MKINALQKAVVTEGMKRKKFQQQRNHSKEEQPVETIAITASSSTTESGNFHPVIFPL